tara:strand:+ start:409 stop:2547 length:2139 start_codon:yes stop_codon:yes gene_type:complete
MITWNIKAKVMVFIFTVCVAVSCVTGLISYISSKNALQELALTKLTAVRSAKSSEMNIYLQNVKAEIQTLSENRMTIEAMRDFKNTFETSSLHLSDLGGLETLKKTGGLLNDYYLKDFIPALEKRTRRSYEAKLFLPTTPQAVYLQHLYIAANPSPLGQKVKLVDPGDASEYSRVHKKYHKILESYRKKFEFYDIFLVDSETNDIVYSVFKEADFATNLSSGPFREANIAKAFNSANVLEDPNGVAFTDFQYYEPSYGSPEAFIASPIFDGEKRIGVLIFQLSVEKINAIMTGGGSWQEDGLGLSGETYLVAPDFHMRSVSRFLTEDPPGYFDALRKLGYQNEKIEDMRNFGTSILLQEVRTNASIQALEGITGTDVIEDYRGVSVLSSYEPIRFGDHTWALISEIDTAEAFAPVVALGWALGLSSVLIAMVLVAVSAVGAERITAPIKTLADATDRLGKGDRDLELPVTSQDELGHLTQNFNEMVVNLRTQRQVIEQKNSENAKLLLNILPEPIAERLKSGESQIADAFPSASVIFTDLVGFTAWSQGRPPMEVLSMLDELFGSFDEFATTLEVEKIKTIGDAYMAVCGLPTPNEDHARVMASLALGVLQRLDDFNQRKGTNLKMRVGLHCGPVVAGVIGTSKFIYDLWGETVNMASRMESTGLPNEIQISQAFYDALEGAYETVLRGEIEVKGAGKMKTYLLQHPVDDVV